MKKLIGISLIITILIVIGVMKLQNKSQTLNIRDKINTDTQEVMVKGNNEEYNIVKGSLSLEKVYKNVSELKEDSDIIIEGVVEGTKSIVYLDSPRTISEVKVLEIYVNDNNLLSKYQTIKIVEIGGILDKEYMLKNYKDKFHNIDQGKVKPAKAIIDGISPMEQGQKVIIFARQGKGKMIEENYYAVVGIYQGKFLINDDNIINTVPKDIEKQFEDKIKKKSDLITLINN